MKKIILIILVCNVLYAEKPTYPYVLGNINNQTVAWVQKTNPKIYAEFGIAEGKTAVEIAKILSEDSTIYLFDFHDKVQKVKEILAQEGFYNVVTYGNSYKLRDSYNWSLMKLLSKQSEPIFDYVFLDGMHTWDIDGLAFFLIDKLLKVGGYIDFDDYHWTLALSPTLRPQAFPITGSLYTNEQINTKQIKLVVDLLVKRNKNYREIVENKIYQKIS